MRSALLGLLQILDALGSYSQEVEQVIMKSTRFDVSPNVWGPKPGHPTRPR